MSSHLHVLTHVPRVHDSPESAVTALESEVANLQRALQSSRVIATAIGLVMNMYHLTRDEAFAYLQRLSQDNNIKLYTIAEQLVQAAESTAKETRGPDLHIV